MRRFAPVSLLFLALCCSSARSVGAQAPLQKPPDDPYARFPLLLPLEITDRIYPFRSEVEALIRAAGPKLATAAGVSDLADTLVSLWLRYGDDMVRDHGDFYEMSRGRAYWLIVTDDAADTLTDRFGDVLASFVKRNPAEKLSPVRAEWETGAAKLGIPASRIFGFQFVELARRGAALRDQLIGTHPEAKDVLQDAYVRFLWDLIQFYRQLHGTWFDRHTMRIAEEDWIIHRLVSRCSNPNWKLLFSLTAIGVDTTNMDPMKDKFMHRIVVADPDCPDTADFVVMLPHYRLMEEELSRKTEAEKKEIMDRLIQEQQAQPRKSGSPQGKAAPPPAAPKGEPPR